jgi:N-alpha-acetyl-L-2,4-diaminobutyrate deacetylase
MLSGSQVSCTIDLDGRGRRDGHIRLPASTNEGAWTSVHIPLSVVAGSDGPTLLLLGANHGDENIGSLILWRLLAELEPARLRGRVIVVPCMSVPAAMDGNRLWPDGTNLNRSFPGDPTGSVAATLADYLVTEVLPRSDVVADFHSGGRTLTFIPMGSLHGIQAPRLRQDSLASLLSLRLPCNVVSSVTSFGSGLLCTEAERHGKIIIGAELGGGGHISPALVQRGLEGVRSLLDHHGVLPVPADAPPAEPAGRLLLEADRPGSYSESPARGIFESLVELGEKVEIGQTLGRVWSLESDAPRHVAIDTAVDGIVFGQRARPTTGRGDVTFGVGRVIDPGDILDSAS